MMSESLVDASDVEETVTQVLTQLVDPARVYTFICVEIKTNTETVALGMFQKVPRTLGRQDRFFFRLHVCPIGQRVLSFLLTYVLT